MGFDDIKAVAVDPMAAVSPVHCPAVECAAFDERGISTFDGCSGQFLHLVDLSSQCLTIIWDAHFSGIFNALPGNGQCHGAQNELACLGDLVGNGQGRLAAELVSGSGFPLAPLSSVLRIDCPVPNSVAVISVPHISSMLSGMMVPSWARGP